MSKVNLDELGFSAPDSATAPPSSDSSVDNPPEARRKCVARPRRMSAKTADRHTLCVVCRGFDCNLDFRCEECIEWPDEEVRSYAKYHKSLNRSKKNKPSATPPPPPPDSVPSSQPDALAAMQNQVDSLNVTVHNLDDSLSARLDALAASLVSSNMPQLSSQTSDSPNLAKLLAHAVRSRLWVLPTGLLIGIRFLAQIRVLALLRWSLLVPPLLRSLARLRLLLLSLAIAFSLRNLLRVMGIRHPNHPPPVGFRLAFLPLVPIVTPGPPRSRKVAKRRTTSPCETPQRIAWLTSSMRSALTPVHPLTPHVLRDAVSRLGSASLSLLLLGHASDFTPELRR